MNQDIIDEVVKIATRCAMHGYPLERIIWIPPTNATDNPLGQFALQACHLLDTTETPPWER